MSTISCGGHGSAGAAAGGVPALDHVVVVIMENKGYNEARSGGCVAGLISQGASFTRAYAVAHPSQPNYLALWSGGTQGDSSDDCPAPHSPYAAENLGHLCETHGLTWRAYAEDLPASGSSVCAASNGLYRRKHAPWTNFSNLDHTNERPLGDLASDIGAGRLPNLAFVIPNMCHDTHICAAADGDAWLASQLPALLVAVGSRGVVALTWDEDDGAAGNHILTILAGGPVTPGAVSSRMITHYTLLSTICAALQLPAFGRARVEPPITDVWSRPPSPLEQ